MQKMNIDQKKETLDRVNFWITNCDTKSSFLLTLKGVIFTVLFTSSYSAQIVKTFSLRSTHMLTFHSFVSFIEFWAIILYVIFAVKTLYHIKRALVARIDPIVFKEYGIVQDSNIFFGTIAKKTFVDYTANLNNCTYEKDLESQIFINSKICDSKFRHYNKSIRAVILSFVTLFTYLVLRLI